MYVNNVEELEHSRRLICVNQQRFLQACYAEGLNLFQRNKMSPPIDRQAIHQTIKDVSKACGNELKKLNYKDYKSCHY